MIVSIDRISACRKRKKINHRYQMILESVKKQGIFNPLRVVPSEDGNFILIDGFMRYYAAKELGLKYVFVEVVKNKR